MSIHLMLDFWKGFEIDMASSSSRDDHEDSDHDDNHQPEPSPDTEEELEQEETDRPTIYIGKEAIEVATSLVKTCLTQLCKFVTK